MAGMILENKFERCRGNERADRRVEEILAEQERAIKAGKIPAENRQILILPEFVPCQKHLSETEIAFVIFPSNRGGYCIQPQKREYSLNYKCSFPSAWLGLENEELEAASGIAGAVFCHKGGFLMTTETLEEAVQAAKISLAEFHEAPVLVNFGGGEEAEALLQKLPGLTGVKIVRMALPELPELNEDGIFTEVAMEKQEWKNWIKAQVKAILKEKPEAVYVEGEVFYTRLQGRPMGSSVMAN